MNSKVEDGEDSDMEDMAYMEEKKWETGDSEELIRVQEISKTFHLSAKQRKMEHSASKTKTAVDQVSFCVKRGEVFGLLGPNGAGKTTTLRMLATLIRPDSGDELKMEKNSRRWSDADKIYGDDGSRDADIGSSPGI